MERTTRTMHRRPTRPCRHTAMWKDAWRAIRGNGKRFAAMLVIVAVGVMMLGGLNSVGRDIRAGLDGFFDDTSMHDIEIVSTLGLDDDDIAALRKVSGVKDAAGERVASVTTTIGGKQASATVTELNDRGIDSPYVTDGRLPNAAREIAVTQQYVDDAGKSIGDTLEFRPDDSVAANVASVTTTDADGADDATGTFADGKYTIVGTIIDPNDIVNPSGPLALVSGGKTVYPMVVSSDSLADGGNDDGDGTAAGLPYTSAVITVADAAAMNTYDDDYLDTVADARAAIEAIQQTRERERTDAVRDAALNAAMSALDEQKAKIAALPDGLPAKTAAEQKLSDAEQAIKEKVAAIPNAKWIIRDRSAVTSWEDVKTQSDMVTRLGTLFPVLFLVIALLVSLTAVTRMVEEDRQLIGTYKALGYTCGETMLKYLAYAGAACLFGGLLGDALGLIGLPFVFTRRLISRIYVLPNYPLLVDWRLAIGGVLLFVVAITGAAAAATVGSLRLTPAELMRPKAPKAGRTIFLQRVGFIWNHLSFLGKVTARNLFRYKSRALMVIVGVLGCTALMTAGFGMGSSAMTLMPRQHREITTYDVLAVTSAADHADAQRSLDDDARVRSTLPLQVGSVTLSTAHDDANAGAADSSDESTNATSAHDRAHDEQITAQLLVVSDGKSLDGYLDLHAADGTTIALPDASDDGSSRSGNDGSGNGSSRDNNGDDPSAGVIVTTNAAHKLALADGDTIDLTDAMADTATVTVHAIAQYYTGNVVVMTQSAYERAFDADFAPNADLIDVKADDVDAKIAFADDLAGNDAYLSVTSAAKQERDFAKSFLIFFVMIGFIVVMAAILAVVVLYTLASTNIAERERELATIKVLGFRKREVHGYVNKEMLLLACFGIALGLPCGRGLLGFLLGKLDLPGMTIVPNVAWFCYAAAALLALAFTVLVEAATNRSLDRIDMVGALKSPE
ncbi:ABC transporter permease [Bifidobacterium sp. 82T10]|uniref:ABC transporter permease n=1 Tax=Bifidobacterium miconis TaxID=2834435 RepID=A0ABS6WG14_9BIFI|nr:ABC transporter permease [Bifidobacterium miconis]MBW3092960.1 ABC transporter permease [Bifidobacterium miconis]